MKLSTKDIITKKLLDAQENVRDYQEYSKQVEGREIESIFKDFAEESAMQAKKLQELLKHID